MAAAGELEPEVPVGGIGQRVVEAAHFQRNASLEDRPAYGNEVLHEEPGNHAAAVDDRGMRRQQASPDAQSP